MVDIAYTNYDFSSTLPMSIKNYKITKSRLTNARIIYPIRIPFSLGIHEGKPLIFKANTEFKASLDNTFIDDFCLTNTTYAQSLYPNLELKTILFDDKFNPVSVVTTKDVCLGLFPEGYFDKGYFFIPSHLSKVVRESRPDKNKYGILKIGNYTILAFNHYSINMIISMYMMDYLFRRFGEPSNIVPYNPMTYDAFKLLYCSICSQIMYDRVYDSVIQNTYETLKASESLPTIDSNTPSPISNKYKNLIDMQEVLQQPLLDANCECEPKDKKSVENFLPWDVADLYSLYEVGYLDDGESAALYQLMPLNEFLDVALISKESLEEVSDELVMLTVTRDINVNNNIIPKHVIKVGFYVDHRLVLVFPEYVRKNRKWWNRIVKDIIETYQDVFDSIEICTDKDAKEESLAKAQKKGKV